MSASVGVHAVTTTTKQRRNGRARTPPADLFDRGPPGDPEIERALLGSVMLDPRRLEEVSAIVGRDDFREIRHRLLFDHLCAAPADTARDVSLLVRWLKSAGDLAKIGGAAYLAEVAQSAPHSQHATHYALQVRDLAVKRRLAEKALEIFQAAHDETLSAADLAARAGELPQGVEAKRAEAPAFTRLLSSTELEALDLKPRFLVRGVLVEGQPTIIGGRSKVLKTSVAIDLALSLGTGTSFLGRFDSHRVAVGFWSGESGAATIRETARRIAESKGTDLAAADVLWCFDLPRLSRQDHLDHLAAVIDRHGLKVVIIDPLYLALLSAETAGGAGNLYAMGAALQPLSELMQKSGVTLVVLHHFRKSGQIDDAEPAGLEELSMSGAAEWARQWLLLQRRVPYQADGKHLLWMRCGGSAGHGSLWGVSIEEGHLDPDTFTGRTWDAVVTAAADARKEAAQKREDRKAAEQEKREGEHRDRLLAVLRQSPEGETARGLRESSGLNTANFGKAVACLVQEGRARRCEITKRGTPYDGYKPAEK